LNRQEASSGRPMIFSVGGSWQKRDRTGYCIVRIVLCFIVPLSTKLDFSVVTTFIDLLAGYTKACTANSSYCYIE